MVLRIFAIVFIYGCTALGWIFLGGAVTVRTENQDRKLRSQVGQLWGTVQRQDAPEATYRIEEFVPVTKQVGAGEIVENRMRKRSVEIPLTASDIDVSLALKHRRKGLLWYATYAVAFDGVYTLQNTTGAEREVTFSFPFPAQGSIYDDFRFQVDGEELPGVRFDEGSASGTFSVEAGGARRIRIAYRSQGIDEWWYGFGSDVRQVKDYRLTVRTDFSDIDFPANGISPTKKERSTEGWTLDWEYANLLSGVQIGVTMPQKLNPGPWVSRVTFFAPVSLFLFFFLLFIVTVRKEVRLHPMHYFFLAAAFFSFHLLLAYMVDHFPILPSFAVCSAVSIFLVVSYLRIVAGGRFAFFEAGLSQFVYLVLFSCTFFLERFTGLTITVLCILTLFAVMQYTARVDWDKTFRGRQADLPS